MGSSLLEANSIRFYYFNFFLLYFYLSGDVFFISGWYAVWMWVYLDWSYLERPRGMSVVMLPYNRSTMEFTNTYSRNQLEDRHCFTRESKLERGLKLTVVHS